MRDLSKYVGDVFGTVCLINRDDTGIDYEVRLRLRSAAEHAFEEGEDSVCIWVRRVEFGHSDTNCAGGSAFVAAAQEQERIAALAWMETNR